MEVRFKRGTTAQNDAYTGPAGSITVDTEKNDLRVHDGVTQGGHVIPSATSLSDLEGLLDDLKISDVQGLEEALAGLIPASQKGVPNGVATLDEMGFVPASQLPSFVEDVVVFDDLESFPEEGESGKIYVARDTNVIYRWAASGSMYVEIAASPGSTDSVTEGTINLYFTVARARAAITAEGDLEYNPETGVISFTEKVKSVNGETGDVVLTKADLGLGNVENYGVATKEEAEEATASNKYMTPLAIRQFVEHMGFQQDPVTGEWYIDEGEIVIVEEEE